MPDLYEYRKDDQVFNVFWHEGEFYLHDRMWAKEPDKSPIEFKYFDETDDVLKAMLEIGPFKDWKRISD